MALITTTELKSRFPEWALFCDLPDTGQTPDQLLAQAQQQAEEQLLELLPAVTTENMTNALKRHLTALVRYYAFGFMHGNEDFNTKPWIVKQYEASIEALGRYRAGDFPAPGDDPEAADDFTVSARPIVFGEWFTDNKPSY